MKRQALAVDDGFLRFWAAYPKRVARLDALKAWQQLNPAGELVDLILAALSWQAIQPDWVRDAGRFVPYPGSWIRAGRWMDEAPEQQRGGSFCPHTPTCRSFTNCRDLLFSEVKVVRREA